MQARIVNIVIPNETYHVIDSMPVEVCKFSRTRRARVYSENIDTASDYGFCAAHKLNYFGYKIHSVCTMQGVLKSFDILKASVHDTHYLNDISHQFENCVIAGDKGYLSKQWQADLFDQSAIRLHTLPRKNQIAEPILPKVFRKARKRIETLFLQLCDQFIIRRNYAKSFHGFSTRMIAKMTALTLI